MGRSRYREPGIRQTHLAHRTSLHAGRSAAQADCLIIATDVDAVYLDWGKPTQRALGKITPHALAKHAFSAGSMGPKVQAASQFVLAGGKRAP